MFRRVYSGLFFWQVGLSLFLLPLAAYAADISGTVEINKKKFKLSFGYIDMMKPEEPVIVLSDKTLPDDQIPFLDADYVTKNKIHAVVFSLVAKEKKLSDMRWIYLGGDADIPVTVFPAEIISLDLKQADESVVEGTIRTTKPKTLTDLTYSFSGSFRLSAKAAMEKANAPKNASFSGDDSAPVKAYKEYYRAIMAGDAAAMKKWLTSRSLREFEEMTDPKDQAMVMGLMQMRPESINIAKPTLAGNEATFRAEGMEGTGKATGTIKMVLEGGQWKVLQDKWSTVYK